jgi:ribose transport system ATP-binding protein
VTQASAASIAASLFGRNPSGSQLSGKQESEIVMVSARDERESQTPTEVLRLTGVTKRFPGVLALDHVDLDLRAGEVHVLFGENGAGKSTLINIVAGTFPPDAGTMTLQGQPLRLHSPHHARQLGINAVFQEFSLVPTLSVQDNLYLGREASRAGIVDKAAIRKGAVAALSELGFEIDPDARIGSLSRAEQQMVEIAKALQGDPSILILDEPTASLTENEANRLFELVDRLKNAGLGLIYITHRMQEIHRIADRITVLRDGRHVATLEAGAVTEERLIELMTGRTIEALFPVILSQAGEVLLSMDRVSLANRRIHDISIEARRGEIVGIAGLVGSGKSEVGRACYGMERIASGSIAVKGKVVTRPTPRVMLKQGVVYVPPDRRTEGLVLTRPVRENMSLAALELPQFNRRGVLRRGREKREIAGIANRLKLRPPNIERSITYFSGGNQQKALVGRGLTRDIEVFIFDEPTTGVDVGAKVEIYQLMEELCARGAAIVLISSDLPEILHLAHRVYVMHRGRLRAELSGDDVTEHAVLSYFFDEA